MQKSLIEVQKRIIDLYKEKFSDYKGGLNLSTPLIPRISQEYLKNRVLVIGQETNTWYRKSNDDLKLFFVENLDKIEEICIKNKYDHFIKHYAEKYGGKFWEFSRQLYKRKIIKGEMVSNNKLSHCWINFFSVEGCENKKDRKGRPTVNQELANSIVELQGDLLLRIIEILEPKIVLLLTGNSLDWLIMKKGLNIKEFKLKNIDDKGILNTKMLAQVEVLDENSILANIKIFRSYHPSYFMARINSFKKLKLKLAKENLKISNANYYSNIFLNKLEEIKY